MPQCFQLTRKSNGEVATLNGVDAELCQLLNVPVHPKHYVEDWFNVIGFMYAMGVVTKEEQEKKWCDWKNDMTEDQQTKYTAELKEFRERFGAIQDYLLENFTVNSWYEHK